MSLLDLCQFFVDCIHLFFERCDLLCVIRGACRGSAVLFGNGYCLELRILQEALNLCPVLFRDDDKDKRPVLALYNLHFVRDGNGNVMGHVAGKHREMPEPA